MPGRRMVTSPQTQKNDSFITVEYLLFSKRDALFGSAHFNLVYVLFSISHRKLFAIASCGQHACHSGYGIVGAGRGRLGKVIDCTTLHVGVSIFGSAFGLVADSKDTS